MVVDEVAEQEEVVEEEEEAWELSAAEADGDALSEYVYDRLVDSVEEEGEASSVDLEGAGGPSSCSDTEHPLPIITN